MDWQIKFEPLADKNLEKLDHQIRKQIRNYLRFKVLPSGNPKSKGKAISGNKRGLWRYRVEKYRIICRIQDDILTVLVLTIGKRDEVYDN